MVGSTVDTAAITTPSRLPMLALFSSRARASSPFDCAAVRVAGNYPTVERRLADFDQLNALSVKSPDLRRNRFIKPTTTSVDGGSTYAHYRFWGRRRGRRAFTVAGLIFTIRGS